MELINTFAQSGCATQSLQLFNDISDNDLATINRIIAGCAVIQVRAGQPVIAAHTTDNRLYIILNGSLEALTSATNFSSSSNNQHFSTGECVGELSVLDDDDMPYTIAATCDSELLIIEADTLWQLINESNGVARNLLRLLSFRIRTSNALLRRRQRVGEFFRQMSMIDGLTGINNRIWLQNNLPQMIEHAHATSSALSVIMADLDNFKKFNDTYGHIIGDDAIQTIAKILNSTLRPTDFAVRYGGEELLVILPDTAIDAGVGVAERLRAKLAATPVFKDSPAPLPHITASFGVATLQQGQDVFSLIAAADAALYRAKESGRNQVMH